MTAHASELNKVLKHLRDQYDDTNKTVFHVFNDQYSIISDQQKNKLEWIQMKLLNDQNIKIVSDKGIVGPEGFPFVNLTHQGFDFIQSGGYYFYSSVSSNLEREQRLIRVRFLITIILGALSIIFMSIAIQKIIEIKDLEKENELLKKELRH
jgi:hypothetical protein